MITFFSYILIILCIIFVVMILIEIVFGRKCNKCGKRNHKWDIMPFGNEQSYMHRCSED